jgi:hypothetical protein
MMKIIEIITICIQIFVYLNTTHYEEYTPNGMRVGGWYNGGDYSSTDTFECSGIPGSTDC